MSARHVFTPCAASDVPGWVSPPIGLWWITPSPFFIALDSLSMHHLLLASTAQCLGFEYTLELLHQQLSPPASLCWGHFGCCYVHPRALRAVAECSPLRILSSSGHPPCTLSYSIAVFPMSSLLLCLRLVWSNNPILLNKNESGSNSDVKRSGPVYAYMI